jgi:7-cyano-7-deazaguanine synthase
MKAVVVLSGGMDSTTLLYDVINQGYETYALSFDYNQKHKKELECAKKTCEKLGIQHKVLDLSPLNQVAPSALTRDDWNVPEGHYADENMKQTVVPNRNMVLLSLATAYAIGIEATDLFYGAHSGDHDIYPDCRKEFVDSMKESIKLADWKEIKLHAPYLEIDKGDIAIKGKELKVDYSLTWTCYKGKEKACGKCGSCVERLEAFEKAGIEDSIEYENSSD